MTTSAQVPNDRRPSNGINGPSDTYPLSRHWIAGKCNMGHWVFDRCQIGKVSFQNTWDMLGLFWIIQVGRPIQCHLGQKCQKSLVRRYIFGARGIYTGFLLNEDFPSN